MLRVVSEVKPQWVIAENVRGLLSIEKGMVFESVLSDLEAEGYETQAFIVPACAVGAPHRRDRVWIVANAGNGSGRDGQQGSLGGNGGWKFQATERTTQAVETTRSSEASCFMAYPNSERRNGQPICLQPGGSQQEGFEIARSSQDVSNSDILRMEGQRTKQQATGIDEQDWMHWWSVEPAVGRVVNGISNRVDRLRALGNAIVLQVAMAIMEAIKASEEKR